MRMGCDNMVKLICAFGGYVFKPVSPKTLLENKVFPEEAFTQLDKDDDTPVYIMGSACNRLYAKYMPEEECPTKFQAIDDFRMGGDSAYDTLDPVSVVDICGNSQYGLNANRNGQLFRRIFRMWSTTTVITNLIRVAGIQFSVKKNTPEKEFYDTLEKFSCTETVPPQPAPSIPTEDDEPSEKIVLSREEIIDMLKAERERAGSRRLVAMYDAVIKSYNLLTKQNKTGKLVRMADGSRKWFPNEKAEELLKLPRNLRM